MLQAMPRVPDSYQVMTLLLHQVVEQVRDQAMFLVDLDGRLASWNEGVGLILGWSRAEWIGQTLELAYTPEDVHAGVPQDEMRQAAAQGRVDGERWMQRRGGERFYAQGSMFRMLDDDGAHVGYLKALRDDTAAHQAQEESERQPDPALPQPLQRVRAQLVQRLRLRLQQQRQDLSRVQGVLAECNAELRALTQGVRDYAIFTLDTEGCVSSWHPGAALMMGYSAEDAIGMPFERLFSDADRAAGLPAHELRAAADSGEYKGDGRRVRQDGSSVEVATVLTALKAPDARLLGYLKLTQDISERLRRDAESRSMLQAAQQARDAAERASRSKDEFLATISHELRTPLSAILGWAKVLERGACDAQTVQHGLAAISRNARTQAHLIDDLLDMNRIENGQLRMDLQPIELGGIIAAAIDAALPAATAKGVELRSTVDCAMGAAGEVRGDTVRLQQVVANLLTNAIKFTPRGGEVHVTLVQHDGQAQIAVTDTGQGIESDFLLRLFDRFQQQDASTTRRHGGLGIGLSIVHELVRLHGGHVQACSAGPGLGSTFTVTLPTHRAPRPAEPGPAPAPQTVTQPATQITPQITPQLATPTGTPAPRALDQPVTRLDGVSVLVVEDEPDVRAVTVQMLQDAGAHVLAAASAEEGLALLRRHRPAVLLSDIGMPVTDGYELLRRVRELPAQDGGLTPAAAFTAYARPEDRQRVLRAGFQMHLAKPVLPTALVTSVATLMGAAPAARKTPP